MDLLAAISGQTFIWALIWVAAAALFFYLGNWLIVYLEMGPPFVKVAKAIVAIGAIILLVNGLLTLADRPFIRF